MKELRIFFLDLSQGNHNKKVLAIGFVRSMVFLLYEVELQIPYSVWTEIQKKVFYANKRLEIGAILREQLTFMSTDPCLKNMKIYMTIYT